MTSSPLTDQSSRVDAVDALRLLMADLQSLADRLQLKDKSRSLQQTLKATQERVSGPRAAVMLLSEEPALKRRFLERLVGPGVAQVPETTSGFTRLEYGAEAEGVVVMPQGLTAVLPLEQMKSFLGRRGKEMPKQAERTIRLPNPALQRGLMVIDTPPLGAGELEPALLDAAAGADAWVLVLASGSELSAATRELLRRLPEGAERLEIVVEGAESLSGEQRGSARARLETTLRDACGIDQPRVVFVSAAATEKNEGSFWQGRLATFQSMLMLRGRERWLDSTRALVGEALTDVAGEIEFELKNSGLGLRQARLRLGMNDLENLRARFVGLGQLESERARDFVKDRTSERAKETRPSLVSVFPAEADLSEDHPRTSPVGVAEGAAALSVPEEDAAMPGIPPAPMGEPTFVRFQANEVPAPTRPPGIVTRLLALAQTKGGSTADGERIPLHWRVAGIAVAALFACLIAWALWPRMHVPAKQAAAQWDYQPPAQESSSAPQPPDAVAPSSTEAAGSSAKPVMRLTDPVRAEADPDYAQAETPDAGAPASPGSLRSGGSTPRALLARSTPSAVAAQRARKHHRGFLGLGRVWHWIRHPAGGGHANDSER